MARVYLVIGSVLAVASTLSDLALAQRAGGEGAVIDSVLVALSMMAFLAQWWRSTVAYAVLLGVVALSATASDPVMPILALPLILGASLATAQSRAFLQTALVSAVASVALLCATAADGVRILWLLVPLVGAGAAIGLSLRRARHQSERDSRRVREAERVALEAAERERRILARDLHDIVAHNLTIISMQASAAEYAGTAEAAKDVLRVVGDSARDALTDLRRMLVVLQEEGVVAPVPTPGTLETDDAATVAQLGPGAERLAEELRLLGIQAHAHVDLGALGLKLGVRAALYRVMQEATTNVAKHAGPGQRCTIVARVAGPDVVLEVVNTLPPGGPRDVGANSSGVGLTSMRDRLEAFGGRLEAGPGQNGGWRVRASVPHLVEGVMDGPRSSV